ncbi:MAG: hypothetical protein PHQ49_07190 [Clostridia bacterium]|nr:hypothetical protein [Clostridia bacterium]
MNKNPSHLKSPVSSNIAVNTAKKTIKPPMVIMVPSAFLILLDKSSPTGSLGQFISALSPAEKEIVCFS